MSLEEDDDDLLSIEEAFEGGRSHHRKGGKTGWTGNARRPEKETPEDSLRAFMSRFEPKTGDPPERIRELKARKEKYNGWVNDALIDPERIMADEDLEVNNKPEADFVNVRHEPSTLYSRRDDPNVEGRLTVAKEELKMQLENHLSLWDKAGDKFRSSNGIVLQ